MSDSENEAKGFQVKDKRQFTSDGELRPETEEVPAQPVQPAQDVPEGSKEPREEALPEPHKEEGAGKEAQSASQTAPPEPEKESPSGVGPPPELHFLDLVNMLAGNALVSLGDVPEPVSGKIVENLDGAQAMIALLTMLQEKTKGNLEEAEEKILGDLLYDLRMRFLAKAKLINL